MTTEYKPPLNPLNTAMPEEGEQVNPITKSDGAWKQVLDRWFPACLACLWPDIAGQIDWGQPVAECT